MISIIVCHRNEKLLKQFKCNIEKTIGVLFELIIINNKNNSYNIFKAYNEGVKRSKFEIICFAHEDIIFHTNNWGKKIFQYFQNSKIGLIGVNGGKRLPTCPAPWWNCPDKNTLYLNNIQHWKNGVPPSNWVIKKTISENPLVVHQYFNPTNEKYAKVTAVDGFFFSIKKTLFNKISFDEITFNGFHGYDTDISLQVLQLSLNVIVIFDVLIEHLSDGNADSNWVSEAEKVADKWSAFLKKNNVINGNYDFEYDSSCLLSYCYRLQVLNFDDDYIKNVIKKYLTLPNKWQKHNKRHLLLKLWQTFGYNTARYPYRILKYLF